MNPYAGVICCGGCGKVDIDEREYMRQMSRPDSFWVCPQCGSIADFDDARFEELNPEIEEHLDRDALGE